MYVCECVKHPILHRARADDYRYTRCLKLWKKNWNDGMIDVSLSFIRYCNSTCIAMELLCLRYSKKKIHRVRKRRIKKILSSIARKPTLFSLVVLEYFASTIATFFLCALFLSLTIYII